jgi:hypothetical protein
MRLLFAVCLLVLPAACVPPGENVAFDVVIATNNSLDFVEPEDLVIQTEEQWCDFWARAHSAHTEPPACDRSVADFGHETVLAVTMGSRATGCFSIAVDEIVTGPGLDAITVFVREQVPGPACICTQSFTSPAQAVVVDNPIAEVDFVRETVALQCE